MEQRGTTRKAGTHRVARLLCKDLRKLDHVGIVVELLREIDHLVGIVLLIAGAVETACQSDANETREHGGTDPAAARRVPNAFTAMVLHCWAPPAVSCGGIWVLALSNASRDARGYAHRPPPIFSWSRR